jgi:hypothetical protein
MRRQRAGCGQALLVASGFLERELELTRIAISSDHPRLALPLISLRPKPQICGCKKDREHIKLAAVQAA